MTQDIYILEWLKKSYKAVYNQLTAVLLEMSISLKFYSIQTRFGVEILCLSMLEKEDMSV